MQQEKVTKLAVREDMPATITSSWHGANLDAVGFNIGFLLRRRRYWQSKSSSCTIRHAESSKTSQQHPRKISGQRARSGTGSAAT